MPAERRVGMDHEHYDWSPIVTRGQLRWPDGARVALCVIVNLEHMEWSPPEGSYQSASLSGGLNARPFPDYSRLSHREYGHRGRNLSGARCAGKARHYGNGGNGCSNRGRTTLSWSVTA